MCFSFSKKPQSAPPIHPQLFTKVTFDAFDFPKSFLFFGCEKIRTSLSPHSTVSLPPASVLLLPSPSSEAFDWKHALFNHWGDSPCPVFAPLPRCNNEGRVTLSQLEAWCLKEGVRGGKKREENESSDRREEEKLTGRISHSKTKMKELI